MARNMLSGNVTQQPLTLVPQLSGDDGFRPDEKLLQQAAILRSAFGRRPRTMSRMEYDRLWRSRMKIQIKGPLHIKNHISGIEEVT